MKVAYITGRFPCTSESFIAREISSLARRGIQVHVFALSGKGGNPCSSNAAESIFYRPALLSFATIHNLCALPFRPSSRTIGAFWRIENVLGTLRALWHFLTALSFAREAERLGVTHIHAHFAYVTADIASAMGEMLAMRYTLSVHAWDLYVQSSKKLERRALGAARVLACTQQGRVRVLASAHTLQQENVTVMRHGLELSNWPEVTQRDSRIILAVGRLVEKKGFATLIEACTVLRDQGKDFSCVIVGDGPERHHLERAIEKADLAARVILKGELRGTDLHHEFNRAAVFALPSIIGHDGDRDGLPNTVLEAMATGLPVVVTTASAAPEVVTDGKQGFIVEPANSIELADRIAALLKDPSLRQRMGTAGRTLVQEDFDINKNIEMLISTFNSCTSQGQTSCDE